MLWSWILGILGVTGLWLAGKQVWWGWLITLINEILWITYAIATEQYGFIFMAICYAMVYLRNAIVNRRLND
jgi:hypothetical protein